MRSRQRVILFVWLFAGSWAACGEDSLNRVQSPPPSEPPPARQPTSEPPPRPMPPPPPSCTEPAAPTVSACGTSWDRRPVIEFDPLPEGLRYEVFVDGAETPAATINLEGQNFYRPDEPLNDGAPPPGLPTRVGVRACDGRCCSVANEIEVALVESCSTPIPATADNVVISEYVTNGDGPNDAGEAVEISNLSHCPVSLDGMHFSYCNDAPCAIGDTRRWMNFDSGSVIPPRGVYISIRREEESSCPYPFFGEESDELFGLRVSRLEMQTSSTAPESGWFLNTGGGSLRVATDVYAGPTDGETLALISPYSGAAGECQSIGFDAFGACGEIGVGDDTGVLSVNQLGRLWQPCDALTDPVPVCRN